MRYALLRNTSFDISGNFTHIELWFRKNNVYISLQTQLGQNKQNLSENIHKSQLIHSETLAK